MDSFHGFAGLLALRRNVSYSVLLISSWSGLTSIPNYPFISFMF